VTITAHPLELLIKGVCYGHWSAFAPDPGPHPRLDVLPAAELEDHGLDARAVQQVGEREARRAGADDPDLGSRRRHAIRRSVWRGRRRTGRW